MLFDSFPEVNAVDFRGGRGCSLVCYGILWLGIH